ncbi:MAG TPA: hypothetical protein HA298_06150 [Methanobacteriales archaeon]|nr:MAG: hypothetical protein XD44_0466 [Methanobacteriaceae archaeon 41_258]MBC7089479.1 hypothetical protein [Methanobacteriaceae archaeon]MBC7096359.1 hypothetical protein [Methanobacteriales archaeon]HIH62239.1 hypothetical protein [Methanobacteriales archaeon]
MRAIAPLLLVMLAVAVCGCTSTSDTDLNAENSDLKVENLEVIPEGYGYYSIKGQITPSRDFDYLEIVLRWYDAEGSVIQEDPLAWNINNVKSGQSVKFSTYSYIDAGTPAKVDLMIFEDPFSSGDESSAIYKTTLNV